MCFPPLKAGEEDRYQRNDDWQPYMPLPRHAETKKQLIPPLPRRNYALLVCGRLGAGGPGTIAAQEFLKNIIGESRWREKRVLGQDAVGDATTPSGCGSNGCSLRVRRLRELHGNSRSTTTRSVGIGSIMCRPRRGRRTSRAPARPRISSKKSSPMNLNALIDHYRIVRAGLYKGFGAASEIGDCNALALIAGGSRGIG